VSRADSWVQALCRSLARRTSRRGFLAALGAAVTGGVAIPLLPIARAAAQTRPQAPGEPDPSLPEGNPEACTYWRYCALDGFLSASCGGTHRSCPPGTKMSAITWLGTCRNPADGREYVISYNDCCGRTSCGRSFCKRDEGDKPVYYTQKSNDIDWCVGADSLVYNSTAAVVVGVATAPEKHG